MAKLRQETFADGLRYAAWYLSKGAAVNLDGIEDRLTPEEFSRALMQAVQMLGTQLGKMADNHDAKMAP